MSLEIACFKAICLHHLMVLGAYCKWVFVSVLLLSFWWVGLHTQDIYLLWCFYRNFFHNASQSPIKAEVTVKEPSLCSGQHLQDMDRLSLTMNWFKIRCFNFVQQAKCFYTDQKNIGLEFLSPCGFIFFKINKGFLILNANFVDTVQSFLPGLMDRNIAFNKKMIFQKKKLTVKTDHLNSLSFKLILSRKSHKNLNRQERQWILIGKTRRPVSTLRSQLAPAVTRVNSPI